MGFAAALFFEVAGPVARLLDQLVAVVGGPKSITLCDVVVVYPHVQLGVNPLLRVKHSPLCWPAYGFLGHAQHRSGLA
jgi:hypothetical protein